MGGKSDRKMFGLFLNGLCKNVLTFLRQEKALNHGGQYLESAKSLVS